MPRQNRYHPYAFSRQSGRTLVASPPLSSPRYPSPPSLTISPPKLYTVPELGPTKQAPLKPCQGSYPPYIRGTTSDGKALVTKSIIQGPSGVFYVEMQAARFPSECLQRFPEARADSRGGESYESFLVNESYAQIMPQDYSGALRGLMSNSPAHKANGISGDDRPL